MTATDANEVEASGVGSLSTFYHGKRNALKFLAEEKLGKGATPFKFKSRAKHSAYKECHDCQTKRLAVARAIKCVHALARHGKPHLLTLAARLSKEQ